MQKLEEKIGNPERPFCIEKHAMMKEWTEQCLMIGPWNSTVAVFGRKNVKERKR